MVDQTWWSSCRTKSSPRRRSRLFWPPARQLISTSVRGQEDEETRKIPTCWQNGEAVASQMIASVLGTPVSPRLIEHNFRVSSNDPHRHGPTASRSMVSFEDGGGSTPECSLYQQVDQEDAGMDDPDEFHQPEKKRRLTVDQVQFLERSFEMENKLEPERKAQLAKDLGLQPRQVAIWFQNRRARWKTKQLEKDYETLKCSYNSLRFDYENLLKDKERLKAEVMVLTEKVLLKDGEDNPRAQEPLTPPQQRPRAADPGSATNVEKTELFPAFSCKLEDISSANSALLDSDSSHRSDEFSPRFNSPNAFEQDHSDLSHTEDEGEMYRFPKLEDGSCHYGFHVEDQDLWFWPSY